MASYVPGNGDKAALTAQNEAGEFPTPHTAEWFETLARIEWGMGHEDGAAFLFRKADEMRLAQAGDMSAAADLP